MRRGLEKGLASIFCVKRFIERMGAPGEFEQERAYLYLLDVRGQRCTDAQGLTAAVRDRGVSNDGYTLTRAFPDKRGAVTSVPILAQEAAAKAVWIPRAELLDVLAAGARRAGARLRYGCGVRSITAAESADARARVVIGAAGPAPAEAGTVYAPRLLLGCDGLNSCVRAAMAEWSDTAEAAARFAPVALPSPSAGLRYKMLRVPPTFALRNMTKRAADDAAPLVWTEPGAAYAIPSAPSRRRERLRLGLLPTRDASVPRTANVIRPRDHRIWSVETADELESYLRRAFPQVDDIGALVSRAEAEAFVGARPGEFPPPQYVPQLTATSGATACALLGDSAHAFPPDLGQGVNAALEDALTLEQCMRAAGALAADAPPASMADALTRYQSARAPAAEALARLVAVGFPFQYDQEGPPRPQLFIVGFGARLFLSKLVARLPLLRDVFTPPAALGVISGEPYARVWRRAQRTTRALQAIGALALVTAARVARRALLPL